MPEYNPVTDAEWNWLQRRFAALQFRPGTRELFNQSLPGSPLTAGERRRVRAEIFQAVREMMAPTEAYPNPWFELMWVRAVQDNPDLLNDVAGNRAILWEAYFTPAEEPGERDRKITAARNRWDALTGGESELIVTTDREIDEELSE